MDVMVLVLLLGIFVFVAAIISFQNKTQIKRLLQVNKTLTSRLELLNIQLNKLQSRLAKLENPPDDITDMAVKNDTNESSASAPTDSTPSDKVTSAVDTEHAATKIIPAPASVTESSKVAKTKVSPSTNKQGFDLEIWLRKNLFLWLGGLVLAMGGLFLARYAIEANLISPALRVTGGALFGIALVALAEYLNRHAERFAIHSGHVVAAIASGGSITCFAMTMVAWDVYQFIANPVAFGLLAIISLSAISLALRYGPIMAVVGIIGAYLVPVLVSSDSANITLLLLYVCFISAAAIWVSQRVSQSWLWWQALIGHFVWLAAATAFAQETDILIVLITALLSIYLFILSDLMGWRLQKTLTQALPVHTLLMPRKEHLPILFCVILLSFMLWQFSSDYNLTLVNLVLGSVLLVSAVRYSALDSWPFLALMFALFSLYLFAVPVDLNDNLFPFRSGYLFAQLLALVFVIYAALMSKVYPDRIAYLLLLVLAPISSYSLSYLWSPVAANSILNPVWITELLLLAAISCYVATRAANHLHKVSWLILCNACVTLCLTLVLSKSLLTLALLVQVTSMCYLTRKYLVALPDWLFKVAIGIATLRLTLSPWLDNYADETLFTLHWTLIVYPLSVCPLALAYRYSDSATLRSWITGAILHLIALFVTTESSWLLVGHYPIFGDLSFNESVLLAFNWMLLGCVYLWRMQTSNTGKSLYQFAGLGLLTLSLVLQLGITAFDSPYFSDIAVGTGIINWQLPLWALPALLLIGLIRIRLLPNSLQQPAQTIAGVYLFLFINGMIRNQFQGGTINLLAETSDSELYTYSFVWLLLATTSIFMAHLKGNNTIKKVGFGLLAMVVLKAFLVDMANLEGLYRALSFIGLGLSLVGIGWLFQKIQKSPLPPTAPVN